MSSSSDVPVVYSDDPDRYWSWTVNDDAGGTNDWDPVEVAIGDGGYTITAEWLGDPSPQRRVKVPLDGLEPRSTTNPSQNHPYTLYLKVPGANDIKLGQVKIAERA